ncbi:uncharacterized protein LOC128185268 [Crassostrea angulata]|uniref:uncharacterized protein LOC128185268 n=1 Tax=Magallana angulata TaxID=2784310 RepID=UPI0022B0FD25|nr:uncharacterized protein LOC128185268 [Crassostrea angulata]
MTHVIVLMLVFCGVSGSATTEAPFSPNELSGNITNAAVQGFSENITNAVPFYDPFPVNQQDIDNFRQQLNQESLIRLSLTNQMYSLLKDVIVMKKQMGQMDSIIQELAHRKNSDKEAVFFHASISKHLQFERNTPVNIIYDTVLSDSHKAYSFQSGVFTAPSSGLYIFSWSSLVEAQKILNTELIANGLVKGRSNCYNEGGPGYENCSGTVPVILKAGDTVNIRTHKGNYVYGDGWSSFKGWKN